MISLPPRHREDPVRDPGDVAIHKLLLDCFAALAMTVALLFAAPVAAQTFPERGRSPVVDQANLLSPQQEAELTASSEALYKQSGRPFVVATVNSLEGLEIEDYGYRLGRHWKLGDEKRDDGVILLVAPNEKKVRIETGYGAEGFLPDILAGRIIRNDILPRFREGDMAAGIMAGAGAIIQQMSLPPGEARQNVEQAQAQAQEGGRGRQGPSFMPVIFWMMIIAFVLLGMGRRGGGRRYRQHGKRGRRGRGFDAGDAAIILWGLSNIGRSSRGGGWGGGGGFGGWGGGGGGFGGFSGGGGSFGGGGASGSW